MEEMYDLESRIAGRTRRAAECLIDALQPTTENEEIDINEHREARTPKFWPSTVAGIDERCGGFYGMSVVSAPKGAGKSTLAMASAIEAAATHDWEVVMFVAEDDMDGVRERFNRYMVAHPDLDPYGTLYLHSVGRGQTPMHLALTMQHCVDRSANRPILGVLDSINSIVNLSGCGYFDTLRDIGLWCMLSRRMSMGDVSWLIVSETNKSGRAKGEGLPYWADVSLILKKCEDSQHVVDMVLDKSRRTPGEGELGKYYRSIPDGRFKRQFGRSSFHVVNGGDTQEEIL
jgi:predicted ATP-dependent serine protease